VSEVNDPGATADDPARETGGGAFAPPEGGLAPEERDLIIDSIAVGVVRRKLAVPAVFFLEMHKPLCFFGSQLLLLGSPVLGAFLGFSRMLQYSSLLEERENVERLIARIEELEAERRAPHGEPSDPAREAGEGSAAAETTPEGAA
jgi:hypothetical protein